MREFYGIFAQMRTGACVGLAIALTFAVGCSSETGSTGSKESILPTDSVAAPASLAPGDLALIAPTGELQVGATVDDVERLFPTPSGAFALREAPSGFSEPYKARGYENYREGFGVILYGDKVALAMRRMEDRSQQESDNIRAQYITRLGPPNYDRGSEIQYLFWYDQRGQRLMLCITKDPTAKDRVDITVALGDVAVMDALRMNAFFADQDRGVGEGLLKKKS